jgi:hypothetical protein
VQGAPARLAAGECDAAIVWTPVESGTIACAQPPRLESSRCPEQDRIPGHGFEGGVHRTDTILLISGGLPTMIAWAHLANVFVTRWRRCFAKGGPETGGGSRSKIGGEGWTEARVRLRERPLSIFPFTIHR